MHLLRLIYESESFTEAHMKVMHLLRLIYENELFIKRWCIY